MTNLACTTPISDAGTALVSVSKSMNTYYTNEFGPITDLDFIKAFNNSVGYSNEINIFFQVNLSATDFNKSILENFWSNNTKNLITSVNIDIITTFIIQLGDRPKNESGSQDPLSSFYTQFANPYVNFILNYLFCNLNTPDINFTEGIVYNNIYRFLNGGSTGDSGGTRGAGTKLLCTFCTNFLTNKKITNPYNYIAQNDYIGQFCGCCSQLNESQPSIYEVPGVSIPLVCQPICHSNPVIKPYDGNGSLVNNGYDNNLNPTPASDFSYLRRQCPGQTICIIDNINVSILGGSNKVVFNQICPGCNTTGGCVCYLDFSDGGVIDTVTDGVNGLQNQVTFKQNCPVSLCSQKTSDSEGNLNETFVPCNPFNTSDTGKNPNTGYNGDGSLPSNSSNATRDNFIFGLSNWLEPVLFLVVAIVVVLSILIVNLISIKREIYLSKS